MQRLARLVTALTCIAGCAHWEPLPEQARPRAADYPDAQAVVLDDDLELRFRPPANGGPPLLERTQRLRVYVLRDGADELADLRIPYRPGRSSLSSFEARTVAPDGSVQRYGRNDLFDLPLLQSFELYSDNRALAVHMRPPTPGTLIDVRYTVLDLDWELDSPEQRFESPLPCERAGLTVVLPSPWKIAWSAQQRNQPLELAPTITTSGGETRLVWEKRHLPALPAEPFGASPQELATTVGVRLERWSEDGRPAHAPADARELSAWLYRLALPATSGTRAAERARELVAHDPPDPTLRARHLYNWVRDHISYCAIEIGIGGIRPHAAGEVERLRYGDCKDKANLLHEMLAAVGISSQLVILYAHDGLPMRFDPTLRRINHAILAVRLPGGDVLADPTSRATPFGALPLSDQEAEYLPLLEGGALPGRAPGSRAEDNGRRLEIDLLPSGDDLVGSFRATVNGGPADELRARLIALPAARQVEALAETLALPPRRLTSWKVEDGAPPDAPTPVAVTGQLALRRAWPAAGLRVLSLAGLVGTSVRPLPRPPRRGPLVFRCRQQVASVVRLAVAETTSATLPPPVVIERPYGRYALRWSRAGGQLVASVALELREHVFPVEQYADVKQFFDEILVAEERAVMLRGSTS